MLNRPCYHRLVLTILLVFYSHSPFAQNLFGDFRVSRLTLDDGLSQGSNYFVFEDSKGFMWITGNDALNRYDGSRVKVYNLKKYFSNCPTLQQGYGFSEDIDANIYVGSTRGIYVYTRKKDRFSLIRIFDANKEAMPIGIINGKLWCYNSEYQLAVYDIKRQVVEKIINTNFVPAESMHIYNNSFNPFYYRMPFIDNENNIWLTGENKIAYYNIKSNTIKPILKDFVRENKLEYHCVTFNSSKSTIYLGTNRGIVTYNTASKAVRHVKSIDGNSLELVNKLVTKGNFVVGRNASVESFQSNFITDTAFATFKCIDKSSDAKYNKSDVFNFDKSGRLWICDDGKGMVIFDFKKQLLPSPPQNTALNDFLNVIGIAKFEEVTVNKILLQGCFLFNKENQHFERVKVDDFERGRSYLTCKDKSGNGFWAVNQFSREGFDQITHFDTQLHINKVANIPKSINMGMKQHLTALSETDILISSASGLFWFFADSKKIEKVANEPYPGSFYINRISGNSLAISYLHNDMQLVQYKGNGQLVFQQKILPGVQSFYLSFDKDRNQYWVGSNQGVFLLDREFKIKKLFDPNTGLAGSYIYGLLLDNEGNAWCSHQRGLSMINAEDFRVINFTKEDGIQDWDFNNRAFLKTEDGTLFFGGVNGFNYFKPPVKPTKYYKAEVYVDDIQVNNKDYRGDIAADNIQTMRLEHWQNNIFIQAYVKDLEQGDNEQLYYRINKSEWVKRKKTALIQLINYASGNYIIELGVYNKFANNINIQKRINIIIAQPIYKSILFWITVSVIATVLLLWGIYQWTLNKHKRKFEHRLALEQQRQKITADLHDDVGSSLSSLQINSAIASHLINNDIGLAKKMIEKIEDQSKTISEKIGDFIWSMKPAEDQLMSMSSKIKTFMSDILGNKECEYSIDIDDSIDTVFVNFHERKNIVLITKEAINNAAKYSEADHMSVSLKIINGFLEMKIEDNGIGIANEKLMGNGLKNMYNRVKEMNGTFEIQTSTEGTSILAFIPIP